MFGVRVRIAALLAMCISVLSIPSVLAHPATTTVAQAGSSQLYLPMVAQHDPRLYIKSARAYEWVDDQGRRSVYVVGEIANASSETYRNITANVGVSNQAEQVGIGGPATPVLRQTFPGQTNPFTILFEDLDFTPTHFGASIADYPTSFGVYVPLPISNITERDNQGVEVSGNVQNNTAEVLDQITVALTLYDADGEVVDVGGYEVNNTFQPGTTQPFTITTFNDDPTITDYLLQAQGNTAASGDDLYPRSGAQHLTLRVPPPADARLLPRLP